MLEIEELTKKFKGSEAVKSLGFSVRSGKIMGLLGPNGAGKTTTLRCIAGMLVPDAGKIRICGYDVASQPIDAKRVMAYLPDNPIFFDSLTCWEHILFIAEAYQVKGCKKKAEALFRKFAMWDKRDSMVVELSKGMKQKLALICAFVRSPKAILFDEPMTGLDPMGIKVLNELLRSAADEGAAIILSSHLLPILEEVCTTILVMNYGQMVLKGTLKEIREGAPKLARDASLEEIFFYATKPKVA